MSKLQNIFITVATPVAIGTTVALGAAFIGASTAVTAIAGGGAVIVFGAAGVANYITHHSYD